MQLEFNLQKVYGSYRTYFLGMLILPIVANATSWESKFYNPKPLTDDVILPMPCDGSMVMRKVLTPTQNPLDDVKVVLGSDKKELGFAEYATPNYIAGSFSDSGKERYFLIGKYEISVLQYQAVMNDSCPIPKNNLLFPITNISWFDAVAFTNKYNEWLLKNYSNLPKNGSVSGYLRLPTNSEWEYAARGGAKVSDSEFRENIFPMSDGSLTQYAWFSGSKSANGKLQLIGRLAANPLGIHDILGNVSEMMFDSFKMNKLDRYHGQLGAMLVRGGSYLTAESSMSTSLRLEKPYYDSESGKAYSSKDLGMRLVLTSEVMSGNNQIKLLDREWNSLGKTSSSDQNNVVSELEKLTNAIDDEKTKKELNRLNSLLRGANQARDEQRDRSIQSALQLGAFLCANVSDLQSKFEYNENLYNVMINDICDVDTEDLDDDNMCSKSKLNNLKSVVDESKVARDFILKYYADTIVSTSSNYEKDNINAQIKTTTFILNNSGKANMSEYLKLHAEHIGNYFNLGKVERNIWLYGCNQIKEK